MKGTVWLRPPVQHAWRHPMIWPWVMWVVHSHVVKWVICRTLACSFVCLFVCLLACLFVCCFLCVVTVPRFSSSYFVFNSSLNSSIYLPFAEYSYCPSSYLCSCLVFVPISLLSFYYYFLISPHQLSYSFLLCLLSTAFYSAFPSLFLLYLVLPRLAFTILEGQARWCAWNGIFSLWPGTRG